MQFINEINFEIQEKLYNELNLDFITNNSRYQYHLTILERNGIVFFNTFHFINMCVNIY